MPVSRTRRPRRAAAAARPAPVAPGRRKRRTSPGWMGALIVALFVLGIAWLALYYTTNGNAPVQDALHAWNILIGFGLICGGFGLATQWR